jgi:SNF2 family DNA or RNA helicase
MADSKVVPEATTSPYASKEYPSTFCSTHPLSHDSKLKSETLGRDQEDFKSLRLSTTIALDEDSSDDEDEIQFLKTRSPFAAGADSKRENLLQALPLEEDKALQRLLWRMGFQFLLKGHQPTAVRRVAGVPPKFPLHYQPKMETLDISLCMLGLPARPPTRGILLAGEPRITRNWSMVLHAFYLVHLTPIPSIDEMGLGKTIEAIAGMILYNGIQEHREREQRPCVVVTPNNAVLEQWVTALVKNGVSRVRILKFTKNMKIRHDRNDFILMEKSKLQTELREIFEGIKDKNLRKTTSSLFPQATMDNFRALWVQYEASHGRARNAYQFEKEAPDDCVRRLIGEMSRHYKPCFRTVVLDESHFLKNQLAYWGIAALLLTVHSERAIPMSGTPYNNSVQDLAAAMGYVDLHINPAKNYFWKRSLDVSCAAAVHSNLIDWKREYLVRRTKEQTLKEIGLKSKTIGKQIVEQHPNEIFL